jgi:hypothetical protein
MAGSREQKKKEKGKKKKKSKQKEEDTQNDDVMGLWLFRQAKGKEKTSCQLAPG